jgi:hypothetical protein
MSPRVPFGSGSMTAVGGRSPVVPPAPKVLFGHAPEAFGGFGFPPGFL